jgi:hypothetical protein
MLTLIEDLNPLKRKLKLLKKVKNKEKIEVNSLKNFHGVMLMVLTI